MSMICLLHGQFGMADIPDPPVLIIGLRPANINCMFYLSSREHFAKYQEKIHTTKNTQKEFFGNFCLLFYFAGLN